MENEFFPSASKNESFLLPFSSQSGENGTNNHSLNAMKSNRKPKNNNDTFSQKEKLKINFALWMK